MTARSIDAARLLWRIRTLGEIGRDSDGRLVRLAASDAEKLGRDQFVVWIEDAGLAVAVDRIGNIFGIWKPDGVADEAPLLLGSHIDTVIGAGIYDGCYGALSGLEVIETLKAEGLAPSRPIVVAAFTNEEGARYAPDMMGSLVYAGGLDVDAALATIGTDGTILGQELERIGYAGEHEPGFLRPHAYIELHIEQGPVLEREGIPVGAVEDLQGISWQRVTITGDANHAGTTPISMRRDAGHAAARVVIFLRERAKASNTPTVATVGCMRFEPDVINVIPSRATFTVDLRDPDEDRLREEETALTNFLEILSTEEQVGISVERLARFEPVKFDQGIVGLIEKAARDRGLACRRMTSGAGHDAQMIARIAPSAMIFVPSIGGISHNPREYTADEDLVAGANILLDVVRQLAKEGLPA
ncbi:Zn-dependent hydrolase [Rhizobium leguminosarum]|uniref:Amidase, hydantoinase/carbamoylase family n=1 Tax=Rhizobium leguminosarum bv. trifolii (strain WSM1325) TaxID=395491 RepID=C6B4K1_RHILS|nr:Zn-dependent hydrolase [Rhizobium leguminosarum]ACS59009.1 amidase, hydantoinase/carbamoylase family [Rhizobium leguminosarum bv. trifolii WSM1325]MBY2911026.1 Zn-dependent hydrolase [Rhizobium leguminosarum]MBY2924560.1 Zn-dependent hydrolase [Rhizobium leguminosarum]MBY3023765.1 Zn-dependent hydrolase [Rhizobium leguminosarum]